MLKNIWLVLFLSMPPSASAVSSLSEDEQLIVYSNTFLNAHPDLKYRSIGMENFAKECYKEAFHYFKLGAYYADKPSQGMVAEMYWKGLGVDVDRAEAYAWMDLAAERFYKDLIIERERYWSELTPAERELSIEKGQRIYKKYGDEVAQRRLKNVLERNRRYVTGSRTGYIGVLKIYVNGPNGLPVPINGDEYYSDKFWKMDEYLKWQSTTWQALPTGKVTASELMPVAPKPAEKKDEIKK